MEAKLEHLIAKIKKDGIEEARRQAEELIEQAKKKAASIIEEAHLQAEAIIDTAKSDSTKLKINSEQSLRQAGRDLLLVLREQITALFSQTLTKEVSATLEPEFLQQLILTIAQKWVARAKTSLEIIVPAADKKKLQQLLTQQIAKSAEQTIELKIGDALTKGFRIGVKGENIYYDFTDEAISASLREFLNPTVLAILDSENG